MTITSLCSRVGEHPAREWDLSSAPVVCSASTMCKRGCFRFKMEQNNTKIGQNVSQLAIISSLGWDVLLLDLRECAAGSQCNFLLPSSSHMWMAKHLLDLADCQPENASSNRKTCIWIVFSLFSNVHRKACSLKYLMSFYWSSQASGRNRVIILPNALVQQHYTNITI